MLETPSTRTLHPEYPSAAFVDPTHVLVADGRGSLFSFEFRENNQASLLHTWELVDRSTSPPIQSVPFQIHTVGQASEGSVVAVLSSRFYGETSSLPLDGEKSSRKIVLFDVWGARINLFASPDEMNPGELEISWRRRGENVPIFTKYHSASKSHLLVGSSPYHEVGIPAAPSYEPSPDELAPIPRAGETLDQDASQLSKPPPYSWMQTSDEVTVAFPLPSSTEKSQIRVLFTSKAFSLHVQGISAFSSGSVPIPVPHYSQRALWDGIQPSTSFWTWDKEGEHAYGLLTLHLDKQHEGTRWTHVLAEDLSSASSNDVEVPETLDPSELYMIRENLEKYTAALQSGEDMSGLGLGRGAPSLAQGEMDEEVDASVGQFSVLTWVSEDGSTPSWALKLDSSLTLLSTDLPGPFPFTSFVIKNGLDGTVFTLDDPGTDGDPPTWIHTSTFSALSFVLASKRDTRFTYHVAGSTVLAFESGARGLGANVYIYRGGDPKQMWAKQSIVQVTDGSGGALLGVGALPTSSGSLNIVCLCEGEIVVIHEVV